jgi:hypothetical protein
VTTMTRCMVAVATTCVDVWRLGSCRSRAGRRHRAGRQDTAAMLPGIEVAEWRGRGLRYERLPRLVLRDHQTRQHRCRRWADLGRGSRPVGLFAARTRRRPELVVSPPTMGILSLPVKMQSVVRGLTADTLIFEENTERHRHRRPGGAQGRRANARPTEESISGGNLPTSNPVCYNGSGPTRTGRRRRLSHSPRPENPRHSHRHLRVDPMRYDEAESLLMMFMQGNEFRSTGTVTSAVRRTMTIPTPVFGQHGVRR